jgi:hypothetical protein
MLDDAHARKAARKGWGQGKVDADAPADGRVLAMIFQKNSTRTRFSFDAAIRQLGGSGIISTSSDMQLGRGETIEDTAKVLSRMVDAVMIRANSHADVERFAQVSTVPVINGLTDKSHPCQIMADLLTIEEHRGDIGGKTIAWVGDGNNVCSSFIHAAPLLGFELKIACPAVYHADLHDLARAEGLQGKVSMTTDVKDAVRRRRRRGGRHLGLDGRHRSRRAPGRPRTVPGRRRPDGPGQARRRLSALPAGPPRRGSHRRRPGRPALAGLGRGGKPHSRPEVGAGLGLRGDRLGPKMGCCQARLR